MPPLLFYGHIAQSVEPAGSPGPWGPNWPGARCSKVPHGPAPPSLGACPLWILFTKSTQPLARFGSGDSSPHKPTVILGEAFHPPGQKQSQRGCCSCGGCFIKWPFRAFSVTPHFTWLGNPRRRSEWAVTCCINWASLQVQSKESSFPGPRW